MSRRRTLVVLAPALAAAALLLGGGFGWGYLSHRNGFFPHQELVELRRAYIEAGRPPPPSEPGRWRMADGRRPWMNEDRRNVVGSGLRALGYAEGTLPATETLGVTVRTPAATPGLSLVTQGDGPYAMLLDLDGGGHHRWTLDPAVAFPDKVAAGEGPRPYLRRAVLLPDGGLLGIFVGAGVVRLDRAGELVWTWHGEAHHHLALDGEGGLWVLARQLREIAELDPDRPIVEDLLVHLDLATGREKRQFSLYHAIEGSPFATLLRGVRAHPDGDYFHSNTVVVLDGAHASRLPAFAAGRLMLSMRHQNLVLVVDPTTERAVWAWRGPWLHQHEPRVVAPGHLLVFDNLGAWPKSRALEIDPIAQRVVWSFDGGPQPLVSETCGTVQRLSNGNTVIVASDTGRVVEVTPDGDVAWEWYTPARAGTEDELVATVFQAERLFGDALGPFAALAPGAAGAPAGGDPPERGGSAEPSLVPGAGGSAPVDGSREPGADAGKSR